VPKFVLDEPGVDDLRTILQKKTNPSVVKESVVNA